MASQARIESLMRDLEQSRAEAAEMQARLPRDCREIAGRSLPLARARPRARTRARALT